MSRLLVAVGLCMLFAAGPAAAEGFNHGCGRTVLMRPFGSRTYVEVIERPCSGRVIVVPPGSTVIVPGGTALAPAPPPWQPGFGFGSSFGPGHRHWHNQHHGRHQRWQPQGWGYSQRWQR